MRVRSNSILSALAASALLLCACVMGGGTDDPSATKGIQGAISTRLGHPAPGAKVVLCKVRWTLAGSETDRLDSTFADGKGRYRFPLDEEGAYSVHAEDGAGLAAMSGPVAGGEDSPIDLDLTLKEKTDLYGRVVFPPGYSPAAFRIFVVGHDEVVSPDSDGFYLLEDVPQGQLDLIFASDSFANFLPIDFSEDSDGEAYLEDIRYYTGPGQDPNPGTEGVPAGKSTPYDILETSPIDYGSGEEPDWYAGKDFRDIIYSDSIP